MIVIMALLLSSSDVECALVETPVSTAVMSGTTFQLNCAADNETGNHEINWNYNPLSTSPIRIVYNCQVM